MAQSNVGRQRVVDSWSSHRERVLSELGTGVREGQQRSASRVHRSGRRHDVQHVMEVWWHLLRQHLVGQRRGLIRGVVLHRQPVQQPQQQHSIYATIIKLDCH